MNLKVGQAVWLKIPYPDGAPPDKNRPYLVVEAGGGEIGLLTVSTTEGKGGKLLYRSNYVLTSGCPPFKMPSFIKLDSLQVLPINAVLGCELLAAGQKLNDEDMRNILQQLEKYRPQ